MSSSPVSSARRRSFSTRRRSLAWPRMTASKSSKPPRPFSLARYIAASASPTRSSAVRVRSPATAMPTLAETNCSVVPSSNGRASAAGHALGDADRHLGLGEVVADDAELVAAEARDRVARAQHLGEPPGQQAQQLVAGAVAERVVDELEAVEVEEQHGDRRPAARAVVERQREAVHEQRAVRQAGQRVVQRLAAHLLLGAAALDGVGQHVRGGLQEGDLVGRERAPRGAATRSAPNGACCGPIGHAQAVDRARAGPERAAVRRRRRSWR